MSKKLLDQMNLNEVYFLRKRLNNIQTIKYSKHCLERMEEKKASNKDILRCLHNGEIIEFHFKERYNSCRVLMRETTNRNKQLCLSVDIFTGEIITCYFNSKSDLHNTLIVNNYEKDVDILGLCHLYLN